METAEIILVVAVGAIVVLSLAATGLFDRRRR